MATETVKTLRSIQYHLSEKMIDLAWSVDIYVDGELFASKTDRGAFPVLPDGKIDDPCKTTDGLCLSDILGEAGATAQANLKAAQDYSAEQESRAEQAEDMSASLQSEKESLIAENESLKIALQKLGDETKAAWAERNELHAAALNFESELNQAKSVLAIKDATIESLQAANSSLLAASEKPIEA